MSSVMNDRIFYHIYPLGFCGAPQYYEEKETHAIKEIINWIPHLKKLNVNAVYLGPVFASSQHGYDTSDYRRIDPRLGTNEDFQEVCKALHDAQIKIVLDGVFNHVGRSFWAFLDVQKNLEHSRYKDWFHHLHFNGQSPYGDPFQYDSWEGHYNLVKLNLHNEEVVQYLLESVGMWIETFGIDGLRLDAADCIEPSFFKRLKQYCKTKKEDFWLMGEIIHGNYTMWANSDMLDSVTNYECYKGLYSSLNDHNYFEIAHSLGRQFKQGGIYEHLHLYSFVDNHDVNRIASTLRNKNDVYNLYTMLYTMPSIPSIYYGSEWLLEGTKHNGSDADLRPQIPLETMNDEHPLMQHLIALGQIYQDHSALYSGTYEEVMLKNEQYIFQRKNEQETVLIAFNVADQDYSCKVSSPTSCRDTFTNQVYPSFNNEIEITIPAKQALILVPMQENSSQKEIEEIKQVQPQKEEPKEMQKETPKEMLADTKKAMDTTVPYGVYEHISGIHCSVLYNAKHSETSTPYVVYRELTKEGNIQVCPTAMFLEEVQIDGNMVPRFRFLHK